MISPLHFRYLGLAILFIALLYSVRHVNVWGEAAFSHGEESCGSVLDPRGGCGVLLKVRESNAKILAAIGAVLLILSGIDGSKLEENHKKSKENFKKSKENFKKLLEENLKRRQREEFDGLNDQSDT